VAMVLQFVVRMTEERRLSEVFCVVIMLQWRCSGVAVVLVLQCVAVCHSYD